MSIAALTEVYNETRRLAIAGSGLANGDYRLQKLLPVLEKAGEKAPVFKKIATSIDAVINSDERSAPDALLNLSTLVSAVLYTQGKTGAEGDLSPIESSGFALRTSDTSARVLQPLIEALTSTGSGRMEIIAEAHRRGAFDDLRLVRPAVAAIDDVYAEISEFICHEVLPRYGKAIVPDVRASLNLKGKGADARRLQLLHQLQPDATQPLIEQALESGSKELKVAAISCLKGSRDHLSFILEQTKARAKDVKRAAFKALVDFEDKSAIDALKKALSGADMAWIATIVSQNQDPELLEHLHSEACDRLDKLLAGNEPKKLDQQLSQFLDLLSAFRGRNDKHTAEFLERCFAQRADISKIKGASVDSDEINSRIAALIAHSGVQSIQQQLVDAHDKLSAESLRWAFIAALDLLSPAAVFERFSPYYLKARGKQGKAAQTAIRECLCLLTRPHYHSYGYAHWWHHENKELLKNCTLDPAWLDAAVARKDIELIQAQGTPGHKGAISLLTTLFDLRLKTTSAGKFEDVQMLQTMINVEHPKLVKYFVEALKKAGRRKHRTADWWLLHLIPELPAGAGAEIEAVLPGLNDSFIENTIPYLQELKLKETGEPSGK
jgi:hypothetical protein